MVSFREFIEVHNVRDDSILTFGSSDAGISVFTSDKIPLDINWSLVLIERDADIREVGSTLNQIIESDEFDSFADHIITALGAAVSPQIVIGYKIGKYIASQERSLQITKMTKLAYSRPL